ncbi:MAG: OmpA family protein, partial [Lentisphaerae bacterium]|nr:OmpA family protein [Lentisphaerota bacterium]
TYADMITLLVAVFIMMYAMSVVNAEKFNQLAISIRSGFGGKNIDLNKRIFATPSPNVIGDEPGVPVLAKPTDEMYSGTMDKPRYPLRLPDYVKTQLASLKLDASLQPVLDLNANEGPRISVIINDQLLFEREQTELSDDNRKKLAHIGAALREQPLRITIEGYSSPLPPGSRYKDSWEVASERARQVADCLVRESKINPRRLTLIGYGEWKAPGKSRKVALTGDGEWKTIGDRFPGEESVDRVVISVVIQ